jgi:hypothetical protein
MEGMHITARERERERDGEMGWKLLKYKRINATEQSKEQH